MKNARWPVLLLLGCAAFASPAAEGDQGVLLIGVDVVQLNNKQEPNGYGQALLEFKVKNLETGKRYAKPPTSDGSPAVFKLPAGTYCVHSVTTPRNLNLGYCKPPYFQVTAGHINNAGKWRFGLSYQAGTFALLHAFEAQEENALQAREHDPSLFEEEGGVGKKD